MTTDNNEDDTNKLLLIVCAFDWITPTWAILKDMANGPVARFGILANAGFDRGDIRRLLSKYGVESWGYVYNVAGDLIMISVPEAQAKAAYNTMMRGGVPVLYAPDGVGMTPLENETVPVTTMGNSFQMGKMTIVPAPSVWVWISRIWQRY